MSVQTSDIFKSAYTLWTLATGKNSSLLAWCHSGVRKAAVLPAKTQVHKALDSVAACKLTCHTHKSKSKATGAQYQGLLFD